MLNFKSTNLSALWPEAGMIFSKITKPVYKRWSTLSKGLMLLGLILLVGLGLFSCKKEFNLQSNFQNEGSSLQKFKKFDWNVTEQSFFSLEDRFNSFKGVGDRTDNNKFIFKPLLVEAYNQIAEENNAQHFITNIANSAGFPIWNKSLVYKDSIGHNDLVIIPLSKTGFKIVSSYIMLYRNPTVSSNRFNISSVTRSEVLDTAGVNASIKASQARWLLALDKHVFNLEDENLKSSYCEYLNDSNAGANGPAPNPPITPCQWQQFEICFTPGSSTFWIGGNSVLPPHLDHDHDGIPNQYDNDWNLLVNSGRITQDDFTRMVNEWWYDKYYGDFGSYNDFFDQFNDIQGGEPVNIDWDHFKYTLDDMMFHFDQFFGNIWDDFRDGWYDLWHEVHCFDWGPVNGSATDREVICRYAWVYVCNDGTDNWWNNLINDLYGWEAPQDERDYIYQYWLSNNLGSYGIEFNDIANIVLQYCHEYGPGYEQCADAALLNFIQGNISLTANQISALQSNRILLAQIASFIYNHKNPAEIEAVKDIVYSRIRNSSLNITNDRLEQLLQIQKIAKLTADQLDWLLLHQGSIPGIYQYLNMSNNSADLKDTIIKHVYLMMADSMYQSVNMTLNYPSIGSEQWAHTLKIMDEDPNPEEIALCVQYPIRAMTVYENSNIAFQKTQAFFSSWPPISFHNGVPDAFRHGIWNALNTRDIGEVLAVKFGNAHESSTPLVLALEKEMDLYNNATGVSLGTAANNPTDDMLADTIFEYITLGFFRFLDPLDWNLSPASPIGLNGIIPETKLVATHL
jgi:hypothetical protein